MSLIKCNRSMLLIRRDMVESTPVIVFNHEYAVLQVIHGDDNVVIVTDPERVIAQSTEGLTESERFSQIKKMLATEELESGEEYNRMVARYGMHADVSVPNVEYVYGRPNSREWLSAMRQKSLQGDDFEDEQDEQAEELIKPKRGRPPKIEQAVLA